MKKIVTHRRMATAQKKVEPLAAAPSAVPWRFCAPALGALLVAACAVGPDYERPPVNVPAAFREAAGWKPAEPRDAAPKGDWWKRYGDQALDSLVERLMVDNQNVRQAEAAYRQANAVLAATRAGFWPDLGAAVSANRGRSGLAAIGETDRISLTAGWEADVWGRLRRGSEAGAALADAGAADLASARLSAQATLVQAWFQRQTIARQQRLLERTVAAWKRSLEITRNRFEAGTVARADVLQAETQLNSAEAQLAEQQLAGAQVEHAIAVLLGQPPATLELAAASAQLPAVPEIPAVLPAELLERRPDIAAAERRVMAANAQIGVAQAAYFPALSFSASGGYQAASFTGLIAAPHRFWSVGPALALTLFDGGARSARKEESVAVWEKTVAVYRQSVLNAFQEVEDNLAGLRLLAGQESRLQAAAEAAREAARIVDNQYQAGTVPYLNVLTAQTSAYAAERSLLDVQNRRLQASVALHKALGGGWPVGGP